MTITPHYTIPENLPGLTGQEVYDLVLDMQGWVDSQSIGDVRVTGRVEPQMGDSTFIVIEGSGECTLQAMPGDTLVVDKSVTGSTGLRFATIEEEAEIHRNARAVQPTLDSTEYELTWQNLNGTVGRAVITADQINADDQYLMFLLDGKIVHATRHSQVIEFNQPDVHYDNVRDGDGEPVRIRQSGTENKFLP
jgi:hypothetical protein